MKPEGRMLATRSQSEHAAARDRRYEKSKPDERDEIIIASSFGLSIRQWTALPPEQHASVMEHFTNVMADLYGKHVPLKEAEEKSKEAKDRARKLYGAFLTELKAVTRSTALSEIAYASDSMDAFVDAVVSRVEDVCNDFGVQFLEFISGNELMDIFSMLMTSIPGSLMRYDNTFFLDKNLETSPELRLLYIESVESVDEFTDLKHTVLRHHDWVHAAEEIADGKNIVPQKKELEEKKLYINPDVYIEELFATMFLPGVGLDRALQSLNYVTGLQNRAYRAYVEQSTLDRIAELQKTNGVHTVKEIESYRGQLALLRTPSDAYTPAQRQREYEQMVKYMAVQQTIEQAPDCTPAEIQAIEDAFDTLDDSRRSERYKRFAKKVFNLDYRKDPYLFLREFLEMIDIAKPNASILDAPPN